MELHFLDGEVWWCGKVIDGVKMPLDAEAQYDLDLRDITPNQGAPLLISSKGRYVWSEEPFRATFYKGRINLDDAFSYEISEEHGSLGEAYRAVMRSHFPFYGTLSSFCYEKPIYCTWIEMGYDPTQEKVLRYARGILDSGLPAGILILDDQWMDMYGNWHFNFERFPDPKGMIETLHQWGFRVMLWICPFVCTTGEPYLTLQRKGLLVRDAKGDAKLYGWWNGMSMLMDMANPQALEFMYGKLDALVSDFGVDGFKFDAGKPELVTADAVRYRVLSQNEDCRIYNSIGERYPLAEYREGWKAGGAPLMMRQQDKHHTWDDNGIKALIPNGMVQSLCGYTYNCPDMIGGGELNSITKDSELDQELYVRFAQMCALFPIVQFSLLPHAKLDTFHQQCCTEALALRERLMPYIAQCFEAAQKEGEPIVAPLCFYDPDQGLEKVRQAFCLGRRYVFYPVVDKGSAELDVKLPYGDFVDLQGRVYHSRKGKQNFSIPCNMHTIPLFERVTGGEVHDRS